MWGRCSSAFMRGLFRVNPPALMASSRNTFKQASRGHPDQGFSVPPMQLRLGDVFLGWHLTRQMKPYVVGRTGLRHVRNHCYQVLAVYRQRVLGECHRMYHTTKKVGKVRLCIPRSFMREVPTELSTRDNHRAWLCPSAGRSCSSGRQIRTRSCKGESCFDDLSLHLKLQGTRPSILRPWRFETGR